MQSRKIISNIRYKTSIRSKKNVNTHPFSSNAVPIKKPIEKILFFPINGAGIGHLTRTLAIARRIKQYYPHTEIIFFTTNIALNIIKQEGFLAYYLPSTNLFPSYITDEKIDYIMQQQLTLIVQRHDIDALVFDGVYPYSFLINVIDKLKNLDSIWIQRGMHKGGKSRQVIDREKYFNRIIVPCEATQKIDESYNKDMFYYCPPIIFTDRDELLQRETILKMWNLDPNKKTVYIQLGEGLYYDVNSLTSKVVANLKLHKDLQIVVGESIIAHKRYSTDPEIFVIRDFPNSIYFNAFDFAVITASYNTFHEAIYFGVPTLIFPVKETITDDHFSRAGIATKIETGIVFDEFCPDRFNEAILKLLDPKINMKMRDNAYNIFENGAEVAAHYIMDS